METKINPLAVNEKTASAMIGLSIQTLRNDRSMRRGLPYLKVGRSVRYLVADVEAYLMANRIDPANQ